MTNQLTLPQRAAVALGAAEHEKALVLLVAESKTITEIKNAPGRDQCHAAYMRLKNSRIAVEKASKTATEDAKAFAKAVTTEERRLIAITSAEEDRLQALRDAWDEAIEAEKQRKIEVERQRIAGIQTRIEAMRQFGSDAFSLSAETLTKMIGDWKLHRPDIAPDEFMEFIEQAMAAWDSSMTRLISMRDAAVDREAEAARLKAEREELARLRAESEARRKEDERKAAEERAKQEAELTAKRLKQEAELAAQRTEIARQQAKRDAEIAVQAKAAKEAQDAADALIAAKEAALRKERAEFEQQQAEIKRQAEEVEAARIAEIHAAEEAEERARLQAAHDQALADARELSSAEQVAYEAEGAARFAATHPKLDKRMLDPVPSYPWPNRDVPPATDFVNAIALAFGVDDAVALEWLRNADFNAVELAQAA